MESVWMDHVVMPRFESLRGDARTDVLVIGGGMAGVLCTCLLRRAGVDCLLVEAERIAGGITKNTTAKITAQHGLIYHKMLRRFGAERTRLYLDANEVALREYRQLCETIDCDFTRRDSYVYTLDDRAALERELLALEQLAYPAELVQTTELPMPTAGSVRFRNQAQFHPLKFLAAISRDLPIYEHTRVTELAPHVARTEQGTIRAENIIVATHFPFLNKHGSYYLKLYQHRSYVLGLRGADCVEGMYVDASGKGLSFRSLGDLLLLGGGSHRTGKSGGGWQELEDFAKSRYPDAEVLYRWATQDCMSLDNVPYIGHYSRQAQDLYVATGFNKWGITSSMVAAQMLTDLMTGKENPFVEVFSPSRSILRPPLAVNGAEAVIHLLTPTKKRCPHMGCALKWNPQERSWDCPCHGSRFEADGKIIDNPATGDLKKERD